MVGMSVYNQGIWVSTRALIVAPKISRMRVDPFVHFFLPKIKRESTPPSPYFSLLVFSFTLLARQTRI